MPIVIVNPEGTLLFYNEPAEQLLAMRFEETGEIPENEWLNILTLTDEHGTPIAPETRPLLIALHERRPAHKAMWSQGRDGVRRHVEVTAFPLVGQAGRDLGAVAIFWEVEH
jgi:PAS domain-containing protein